ncbi:MAG: TolC family protein [Desulfurivibrionaceae bacterium]|nr:TolC family protein [Desulfurivibrionaceae bacterium]
MKTPSLFVIFMLMALPCHGVSLVELQQSAMANRSIIEQYEAELDKSSQDVTIAGSRFLPTVGASYTVNSLNDSSRLGEARENSVAQGLITWNLFSGFYDYYNLRSARLLEKAQNYKLQAIKQDIQMHVALRYVDIFSRQSSLLVAQESHATLQRLHKDARHRYEVGLIEKNELLRFQVDLDNAAIMVKKAEAELAKSLERLIFETQQQLVLAELDFAEFDQLPHLADKTSYQAEMLAQRSEIKTLEELAKAVTLKAKAAHGERYPQLDISGSYRKYEDDYISGDGTYDDEELRAQAVVSFTLFDGFARQAKISRARSEKESVSAQLRELKKGLETELTNLFFDYEVSVANAAVAQTSIDQAKENLRITRLKYQEGLEKESNLLDAIANLARAKNNHVAARTDVFANYFKIMRAVEEF